MWEDGESGRKLAKFWLEYKIALCFVHTDSSMLSVTGYIKVDCDDVNKKTYNGGNGNRETSSQVSTFWSHE